MKKEKAMREAKQAESRRLRAESRAPQDPAPNSQDQQPPVPNAEIIAEKQAGGKGDEDSDQPRGGQKEENKGETDDGSIETESEPDQLPSGDDSASEESNGQKKKGKESGNRQKKKKESSPLPQIGGVGNGLSNSDDLYGSLVEKDQGEREVNHPRTQTTARKPSL
ncbi:hypothetical protein DFH28DRAFT_938863 [Melampsora americana]|nr:hypothetical protein DFH28DRAFT_938863 [Melampsora americana]